MINTDGRFYSYSPKSNTVGNNGKIANRKYYKLLCWLALVDFVILLGLIVCCSLATSNSGDTSTALGFVFLMGFIFVSAPVLVTLISMILIGILQLGIEKLKWLLIYSVISFSGHLLLAYQSGFFDKWINGYQQDKRTKANPAQVKLKQALGSRPSSNINDVQDALAKGADPNAGLADNRLPFLVIAASHSDTPVIKALLDAGANPNKRAAIDYDFFKQPLPLDMVLFSKFKGVKESVKLLIAAGADPSQSLMKLGACWRGDLSLYDMAQNLGAPDLVDGKDQTCLHHAANKNQLALLEALLFDPAYAGENTIRMLKMSNHIGQYPLDVAIN